jgi:ferrochelatase
MSASPIGVLVMAYGTASGPDDVERYYTDIRGGRAALRPEHLEELRERYAAIGNRFPLLDITRQQAEGLERRSSTADEDPRVPRVPRDEALAPVHRRGGRSDARRTVSQRAIGIVMAPHWSGMSVESYVERVREQAGRSARCSSFVRLVHDDPGFRLVLRTRVADALSGLGRRRAPGGEPVVFSAHTPFPPGPNPNRTGRRDACACHECEDACRYRDGLAETADRVAAELGLPRYEIAWQSAGRTDDPWWGPPIEEVLADLASLGCPAAVVCSAGFVADHLEILYDLDIEAKAIAEQAGMRLVRTEMPNADPQFVRVLADVVRERLAAPTAMSPKRMKVVIVGGGVAGLATAHRLLEADPALDVTVLESEPASAAGCGARRSAICSSRAARTRS